MILSSVQGQSKKEPKIELAWLHLSLKCHDAFGIVNGERNSRLMWRLVIEFVE